MVLRVENLSFHYDKKREIFHDVQFSLNKGEIMNILGNNGAGKSTLLNCVAGIYKPATGTVWLDGKDSAKMPMREVARLIGYVPQISHATVAYSVLDFVVMGRTPYIGLFSKPGKDDYEIALEALQRLNIEKLRDKLYTELSGGERQQVCIARAIAQKPEVILLDEPTAHLDYGNQYRTVAMVKKLADEGYAVMMTTHNPDHAVLLGGKTAILGRDGNLKVGETQEMINSESMSDLYGMKIETTYSEIAGRKLCIVV